MRLQPLAIALMIAVTTATLAACLPAQAPAGASDTAAAEQAVTAQADAAFAALSKRYLDEGLALSPVAATQARAFSRAFAANVVPVSATSGNPSNASVPIR